MKGNAQVTQTCSKIHPSLAEQFMLMARLIHSQSRKSLCQQGDFRHEPLLPVWILLPQVSQLMLFGWLLLSLPFQFKQFPHPLFQQSLI